MTTCWECPIGSSDCETLRPNRCPLPQRKHHWIDVTEVQDEWRRESCTECHGERLQPRNDVWLIA